MESVKPNVDQIWQTLKGKGSARAVGNPASFDKLWFGLTNDIEPKPLARNIFSVGHTGNRKLTDITDKTSISKGSDSVNTAPVTISTGSNNASSAPVTPNQVTQSRPEAQQITQQEAEALVSRSISALKDTSLSVRRKALMDIKDKISNNNKLSQDVLANIFESGLGKALLRRFDDAGEACRELAVKAFTDLLQACPSAVLPLLPYAMPVLQERIQIAEANKTPIESSEEVRLLLAQLLTQLVLLSDKAIGAYAGEAVEMGRELCLDPFHEVNTEACNLMQALNAVLGLRLQILAKEMVAALLPLTTHKRHRVRIAAVQAVKDVMHQGAHEMILEMLAFRDPNLVPVKAFYGDDLKVNFCGKLATDPNMQVRLEFLRCIADWMLNLRERTDHESRLLPYVLSALHDESPVVRSEALGWLDRLGQAYEKEHEKELKDTLQYLPEAAHGLGWIEGAEAFVYGGDEGSQTAADASVPANGARRALVLPGPFTSRPRLGCRLLVQSNFGRIVHALINELSAWQAEPRLRAAQLLRSNLVIIEDAASQHAQQLLPALVAAARDPQLHPILADCAAVLGAFLPPQLLLALIEPRALDESADSATKASALSVLAHIIRGCGPRGVLDEQLPAVLHLLSSDAFLQSLDFDIQSALRLVLDNILDTCGPACPGHAQALVTICLHSGASASLTTQGDQSLSQACSAAEQLIDRLAVACGCSKNELIGQYRLQLISELDAQHSMNPAHEVHVLSRLLLYCSKQLELLALPAASVARVLSCDEVAQNEAHSSHSIVASNTPTNKDGFDPSAASTATTQQSNDTSDGTSTGANSNVNQNGGSPSALGCSNWSSDALHAVLQLLSQHAAWLSKHPKWALQCMLNFETVLLSIPPDLTHAEAQQALLGSLLLPLLAGLSHTDSQSTSRSALASAAPTHAASATLVALRCLHVAVARRLLTTPVLSAHMAQLIQLLVTLLASADLAVRQQACHAVHALVTQCGWQTVLQRSQCSTAQPEQLELLHGQAAHANGIALVAQHVVDNNCSSSTAYHSPPLLSSICDRLHDAHDSVRLLALKLLRSVLEVAAADSQDANADAEGLPADGGLRATEFTKPLLGRLMEMRDLVPESQLHTEHTAAVQLANWLLA